ncbi:MAG TPA: EAL domain-containing response regulator [Stellaceae bacterium]|nr:EAL domain-containing response regulator [Stellaceae bacterium]
MSGVRALILDDDAAIGTLISRIADAAAFESVATTRAAEFALRYDEAMPAVIMLDLALGDTDGMQQLRYLKTKDYRNALILMSGFDARVLATAEGLARELGFKVAGAITKPVRAAALMEMLARVKEDFAPLTAERVIQAARDGELTLEYQPIVHSRVGALSHVEALVRWNHPTRGRIMPGAFIPQVEESSSAAAADRLTDWALGAAIADYVRLRDKGHLVPMAVNLSARNLAWEDLPDILQNRLASAGMPPADFGLELTESAAASSAADAMHTLNRLRLKGVRLALDDFGAGYSSLKQLRQLPFSILKIDGSFVADLTRTKDALAIVKATLAIAEAMEMSTVAECVETEEQAAMLEELGVGALQGYLIARPLPPDKLEAWLQARAAQG